MRLNSQNKGDFEHLNRPAGIAFALFEGTVKIMNPTLGLALGLALALLNTGCGITFPNSAAPVTEQPLIRIPDNLGPDEAAEATALAPTLPEPETQPEPAPEGEPGISKHCRVSGEGSPWMGPPRAEDALGSWPLWTLGPLGSWP